MFMPKPKVYSLDMYVTAAVKTNDKIMKTMAVHFQEHLDAKLFWNWKRGGLPK